MPTRTTLFTVGLALREMPLSLVNPYEKQVRWYLTKDYSAAEGCSCHLVRLHGRGYAGPINGSMGFAVDPGDMVGMFTKWAR